MYVHHIHVFDFIVVCIVNRIKYTNYFPSLRYTCTLQTIYLHCNLLFLPRSFIFIPHSCFRVMIILRCDQHFLLSLFLLSLLIEWSGVEKNCFTPPGQDLFAYIETVSSGTRKEIRVLEKPMTLDKLSLYMYLNQRNEF